jgi:hypothetical protein
MRASLLVCVSERCDDDPVERAVFKRGVTVIHIAQCNCLRNEVIQVHATLQVKVGIYGDVAFEVGRTEVDALDALSLRYYDTFLKTDGTWLFAERRLYVDWVDERVLS